MLIWIHNKLMRRKAFLTIERQLMKVKKHEVRKSPFGNHHHHHHQNQFREASLMDTLKLGVEVWGGLFIEFPSISLQNSYSLKRLKWEPDSGENCCEASHSKMIKVNIISKCMNLICAVWCEVLRKLQPPFSNIPAKSVKPNSKFVEASGQPTMRDIL